MRFRSWQYDLISHPYLCLNYIFKSFCSNLNSAQIHQFSRYKQHRTDFERVPSERPICLPCQVKGCKCISYHYVPLVGSNPIRCTCKHLANEHSSARPYMCQKCKNHHHHHLFWKLPFNLGKLEFDVRPILLCHIPQYISIQIQFSNQCTLRKEIHSAISELQSSSSSFIFKTSIFPLSARVRRSTRNEAPPHIPEHYPFRVQTKHLHIILHTFVQSLSPSTRTSHPQGWPLPPPNNLQPTPNYPHPYCERKRNYFYVVAWLVVCLMLSRCNHSYPWS